MYFDLLDVLFFRFKDFVLILFFLEWILFHVFLVSDLFFFYVFFELSLIPMFLIIGLWGSRDRSFMLLISFFCILWLFIIFFGFNYFYFFTFSFSDLGLLTRVSFSSYRERLICWLFLLLLQ